MLAERRREMELMDSADLDPALHRHALAGLRRINVLSRSAATLWPFLREAARRVSPQPLRVLDLACGSGDNVVALARYSRRAGFEAQCDGCDISWLAVETAEGAARGENLKGVSFFRCNVLDEPLPTDYHVLTCSLFMHHLSEDQAVDLLARMAVATRDSLVISDLRRTRIGLGLAWIAGRALTRSPVVAVDAMRSVAAAFDESEIAQLAERCRLENYRLVRRWPQRWILAWSKH